MTVNAFSCKFVVQGYECDPQNRMSMGSILRRAQQVAAEQCNHLGMTEEVYQKTHTAFLMAKLTAEFYLPMHPGQEIVLTTQPSAPQKAVYYRYTTFCSPEGKLFCAVDSRWILIDTQTKRILRHAPSQLHPPFEQPPVKDLGVRLQQAEVETVAEETATYTRCDQNRHLNNTYYADILCDHIPIQQLDAQAPNRLVVAYHHEIPLGSRFLLSSGRVKNGYYFTGTSGGTMHFEANLFFPENPNKETGDTDAT